jgi:hypothetical protein
MLLEVGAALFNEEGQEMEPQQAIQAMTTPAVFVSAGCLLLLSLNTRLSSVFGRVRGLQQREDDAETGDLIKALARRAWWLRNAFVAVLVGVGACLSSCMLLAVAAFWHAAGAAGFVILLIGVLALLASVGCYLYEVLLALPSLDLGHEPNRSSENCSAQPSHPAQRDAA